jgi:citrate synthase
VPITCSNASRRLPQSEHDRLEIVLALSSAAVALDLPAPNVDFGLAAAAYVMRLRPAAATTIFTFARIPGLLAHAIEEYPHRLRFRPRASYVGEAPR